MLGLVSFGGHAADVYEAEIGAVFLIGRTRAVEGGAAVMVKEGCDGVGSGESVIDANGAGDGRVGDPGFA